ncbi:MAG: MgtC/SapB family protein [Candidatus Eisenbacteria bacterium]|uniref:MgtC/SapB family protein n=1 Tax=Eiseniibacteriota bacterium TaxID=2212470 RepID=A0A948RSM0_UNCEI|nr:MgtC/SapB family protein [Candidatus Eisenbacteria bacterium]MBU1949712.1 MgtC/SapB family protein [Candidatus Eisenbacteria bacterium]MBU2690258.1 MgtC/SapB family protein [Candidatus Eisenbacteria bacterium]
MDTFNDISIIALRLVGAALLAGIIGFEREKERKPAGLRTHMLVSLGCCLFMLISAYSPILLNSKLTDPSRIAAQIVTGVGFLGAGSILQARGAIYGLTTAASIWAVAAIGMAIGAGFYSGAVGGTALAWAILTILDRWEKIIQHRGRVLTLRLKICDERLVQVVQSLLEELEVKIIESHVHQASASWQVTYRGVFTSNTIHEIFQAFSGDPSVEDIGFGN